MFFCRLVDQILVELNFSSDVVLTTSGGFVSGLLARIHRFSSQLVFLFNLSQKSVYGIFSDKFQPLPEKHTFKRLDRFSQEFVHTRMTSLQKFLRRIAEHPVLSCNKYFQIFLTAKQSVTLFRYRLRGLFLYDRMLHFRFVAGVSSRQERERRFF